MPAAVVTGAGSGLGRAIAVELAGRGFVVLATDIDPSAAAETAEAIGVGATSIGARRARRGRLPGGRRGGDLAQRLARPLGQQRRRPVTGNSWEQDEATRRTMFDVNAVGTMNGTVAALERMTEAGAGHVINVVSLAGLVAAPGEVAYSASKHAAMAFTLGTLFDLRRAGHRGIELSAVCPDGIWTPMLEGKLDDPDAAGSFSGRLLTPEQVATAIGRLTERPQADPRPAALARPDAAPLRRLSRAWRVKLLPLMRCETPRRRQRPLQDSLIEIRERSVLRP